MKKFAFVMLSCLIFGNLSATWNRVNDMNSMRVGFGTAVLTDGRVQVVTSYQNWTHEIFDPATGAWTQGTMPNMGGDAWHPQTILLPNGNVLYVTPEYGDLLLYDPVLSVWNNPSSSIGPCWDRADVTVLKSGQVLLAGWDPIDPFTYCSLYELDGSINGTGVLNVEHSFRAVEVLLHTGEVLIVGGFSNRRGAEVYDPVAGTWRVVSNTLEERFGGTGIRLPPPSNKVLLIGPFAATTEIFDIGTEGWTNSGTLNNARRGVPTTIMLPMGKPIVIGGELNKTCEIYDPLAETWTYTDSLSCPRAHYSSCILHTGKILAIGGFSMSPTDTIKTVEIFDTTESVWSNKPVLAIERAAHTVTPLPIIHTDNCSTNVLITGGENSGGFLSSCELYNYLEEDVDHTTSLNVARAFHGANLLADGKVLVCGGKNSGGVLSSSELFEANGETWTVTGDLGTGRFNHTSTFLSDGRVFVTGGEDGSILSSCETYSAGTWTSANPMTIERTEHSCALLLDGRVLVVGGRTNVGATGVCEIYDHGSGNWSGTGALTVPRYLHTTVVLESGKVLAIAGDAGGGSPIPFCEIYDPGAGTWSQAPSLNKERYSHNSMVIYSGLVLTLGGYDGSNYLSSCEIYDPCIPIAYSPNWETTTPLNTVRGVHSSCNTPELQPFVVTIGGKTSSTGFSNSIEEYDIGLGYQPEWQSTITNYQAISHVSDSMYMQGTLFRGVSEADGGNHCHIVSTDHPIASLLRIGGGNWQSNGGGRRLVMPRSSAWSDTHTCIRPSNPAAGYYMLCTIVNGIPCKWYNECVGVEDGTDRLQVPGSRVRVYPNPATSSAAVHFNVGLSGHGRLTITVYDLSGRLVRRTTHDTEQVTIKGLKPGMYFYDIDHEGVKSSGKFVVVK
jgi:hypothetical protein